MTPFTFEKIKLPNVPHPFAGFSPLGVVGILKNTTVPAHDLILTDGKKEVSMRVLGTLSKNRVEKYKEIMLNKFNQT